MKRVTPLPITLDRRRIYIFPTGHGFVFIAILAAMLVGSINYNNNLGFLLVFLLGGMTLVSILHTWRNLLGLQIRLVGVRPVFAGGDAVFDFRVRADGRVRKGVSFTLQKRRNTVLTIPPFTETDISLPAMTVRRGLFKPERLSVSCRYPLGLFRAWSILHPDISCPVYPAPVAGAMEGEPAPLPGKEGKQWYRSGVDDFMGLKPYQAGDSPRHIAWKRLSAGRGVLSKDFAGQGESAIVFDFERLPGDPETRLSRLCGMVLAADRMQTVYGLVLAGKRIAPGRGDGHKHQCLRALALFGEGEGG